MSSFINVRPVVPKDVQTLPYTPHLRVANAEGDLEFNRLEYEVELESATADYLIKELGMSPNYLYAMSTSTDAFEPIASGSTMMKQWRLGEDGKELAVLRESPWTVRNIEED